MICRTPNKAGNFATSDSDNSDIDSCTDRDFSNSDFLVSTPIIGGAPSLSLCDIFLNDVLNWSEEPEMFYSSAQT